MKLRVAGGKKTSQLITHIQLPSDATPFKILRDDWLICGRVIDAPGCSLEAADNDPSLLPG